MVTSSVSTKRLAWFLSLLALPWMVCADDVALALESKPPPNSIWVDSLDLSCMTQQWGKPQRGLSVDRAPLRLEQVTFAHGVGTHAASRLDIALDRGAKRFFSIVGVDDERPDSGSVAFEVWVDDKRKFESGMMKGGDPWKTFSVDLSDAAALSLIVTDGGDGIGNDHADWAGAFIECLPGKAAAIRAVPARVSDAPATSDDRPQDRPEIAMTGSEAPEIHAARVVGAGRARPFLYRIPATGKPPLQYTASGIPGGLKLDAKTGILSGTLATTGTHTVDLTVSGPAGKTSRRLCIVCEERVRAYSPPMGWNSWKVWEREVSDEAMRYAADWLVNTGLSSHGYQYVIVDNGWSGGRSPNGSLVANEKFPDMPGLVNYVHAKGLKFGLWMSANTDSGDQGIYRHRHSDAETFEMWGIDYFKCVGGTLKGQERDGKPLTELQMWKDICDALKQARRDIVVTISPAVPEQWKLGVEAGSDTTRCSPDVVDTWERERTHIGVADAIFTRDDRAAYSRPGHWNDMDLMVVGKLGFGTKLRPTRLTPNEQLSHVTAWCMQASPLMISCDLPELDPYTRALLTNPEVLAVNQDPLGKAGTLLTTGTCEIWTRPLWDGTRAVAIYNVGEKQTLAPIGLPLLGLDASQEVRDLWRRKTLGDFEKKCGVPVGPHGAALLKVGTPKATECDCLPFPAEIPGASATLP